MRVVAGTAVALVAATMFALGIVLQAGAAREAPAGDDLRVRLLVRLMRSSRWLAGAGVVVAGWCLQAAALLLAPLTVVQPALAFTVVVVVLLAAPLLDEAVGRREALAACAIATGIGAIAVVSPSRSGTAAATGPVLAGVAVLAAFAALPMAARASGRGIRWVPAAAGVAFALSSIATKLLTDAGAGRAPAALAWLAVTALTGALGGINEMTALRTRPAVAVIPVVFTIETLLPVAVAPAMFGERWAASTAHRAALALALAAVAAGVVALGRTRALAAAMEAR